VAIPEEAQKIVATGAYFSPCRKWRYQLWRIWDWHIPFLNVIGLNPSTADETHNDPTIERCQRRAKAMGFGGLMMTNLFAFRATDPTVMKCYYAPIGPENNDYILDAAKRVGMVLCAWGTNGTHLGRDLEVLQLLEGFDLHCLRVTKDGIPGHPLYLPYSQQPKLYLGRK
jgi:hypothetical protein